MNEHATYAEPNQPDASHVSKLDLISVRLKTNNWTGARYENDYWVEARPVGGGLYNLHKCNAKWVHSKSTRRSGDQFKGQSDEIALRNVTLEDAKDSIASFNYRAHTLAEENKGSKNPDNTKPYTAYYPRKMAFQRAITGRWTTPATESPRVSFDAEHTPQIAAPQMKLVKQ